MNCPKCNSPMEEVLFAGITVDRCAACEGIWFDGVEHRDLKKIQGADGLDPGSAKVGREHDAVKGLCPRCGEPLQVKADPFQPHIHYDLCPKGDGVYFDAGEFRDFVREDLGDFLKSLLPRNRKH